MRSLCLSKVESLHLLFMYNIFEWFDLAHFTHSHLQFSILHTPNIFFCIYLQCFTNDKRHQMKFKCIADRVMFTRGTTPIVNINRDLSSALLLWPPQSSLVLKTSTNKREKKTRKIYQLNVNNRFVTFLNRCRISIENVWLGVCLGSAKLTVIRCAKCELVFVQKK